MTQVRVELWSITFTAQITSVPGPLTIGGRIAGQNLSNPVTRQAVPGRTFFPPDFARSIDVEPPAEIEIVITLSNAGGFQRELTWRGPVPTGAAAVQPENELFSVDIRFGGFRATAIQRAPPAADVRRSGAGGASAAIVVDPERVWIEFHPVVPTPPQSAERRDLWVRPAFALAAAVRGDAIIEANADPTLATTAIPVNAIPNPSVIPILPPDRLAEAPHLMPNFVTPSGFDLSSIHWHRVPLEGGAVDILGVLPPSSLGGQQRVRVVGREVGDVRIEARLGGPRGRLVGAFRALVRPLRTLYYRVQILGDARHFRGEDPLSTPAAIVDHIQRANVYLRQVALELRPDPDTQPTMPEYTYTGVPGIFTRQVPDDWTNRIPNDTVMNPFVAHNGRPMVINIAYVRSDAVNALGASVYWDPSLAPGNAVEDEGWPSTSWIAPTGIAPDGPARRVRMTLGRTHYSDDRHFFACYITQKTSQVSPPEEWIRNYGRNIAHEVGHLLTLNHRGDESDPFDDGVHFPPDQNLMHGGDAGTHLDRLQARAIDYSPLVGDLPPGDRQAHPSASSDQRD